MPTYAELETEDCYRDEVIPPELAYLARNLRNHYELPASAVGTRGNNVHVRGYHRSRRWLLESRFARNRNYSVTDSESNQHGGNANWICALDLSLDSRRLIEACRRLDIAVRSGTLEKVAEWYGNKDGDKRVDGYDNIANKVASSDDSHLWHLHVSFLRGHANDNHADVFAVITGVGWDEPQVPTKPTTPDSLEWTEEMIRNLPQLVMGATGAHVRTAQALLCARGFKVDIDGSFGPDSRSKTVAMQQHYGAEHIDGVFGPETWTIALLGQDLR